MKHVDKLSLSVAIDSLIQVAVQAILAESHKELKHAIKLQIDVYISLDRTKAYYAHFFRQTLTSPFYPVIFPRPLVRHL
jgi:hypothetical protein